MLITVLVGAMTASSFQIFFLAVLAPDLIAEFGLSRAGLGLIGSLNTLLGGLTAPLSGRLTDRIGAKWAVVGAMAVSAVGMALVALSATVWMLLAATALLALPQGWGNPATNALIAERVGDGQRGLYTGVKQSGVQFGIFLAGLSLPTMALWYGWQGAAARYGAAFLALAVFAWWFLDSSTAAATPAGSAVAEAPTSQPVSAAQTRAWIRSLAVYAFCAGTVGGGVSRFFPLWAQEVVGLSARTAGIFVAVGGLLGMWARVEAGRWAESRISPARLLSLLALVGALYCVTLGLTTRLGVWVLWPSTVFNAVGIGAWNAVAMLAVIMAVPKEQAGRASGTVMLGFLTGLSVGAPLVGLVVDLTSSYQPVWWGGAVLLVGASRLTAQAGRQELVVTGSD